MSEMHPPADRRCQIYSMWNAEESRPTLRCRNGGTHYEKWGGCSCQDADHDVCEQDFFSWECDGPCDFTEAAP